MKLSSSALLVALAVVSAGCRDSEENELTASAAVIQAGPAATIDACAGSGQIQLVGTAFVPFVACVADAGGAPVANANVVWSVRSGNVRLRRVTSVTDAQGRAQATPVMPAVVQNIVVEARIDIPDTAVFTARATDGSDIVLDTILSGLSRPIYVTAPPGDSRLFIVEQRGTIKIFKAGVLLATPFLDIRGLVDFDGPKGLLGLAFHPQYATNGLFFVHYRSIEGNSVTERYQAIPSSDRANRASAKLIMSVAQFDENHSGGHMLFGPDGRLYIAMGDGGPGADPFNRAQDLTNVQGDLLRLNIDVDPAPYASPRSNPYYNDPPRRPEIWASGLRHPWRFNFDNGYLYIADVGAKEREEVNIVRANDGGHNFGWKVMEGTLCFQPTTCDPSGFTMPAFEYDHGQGCSITGGIVYRGAELPELTGLYFYSDYCGSWIRSFRYHRGQVQETRQWDQFAPLVRVNSFGVDGQGEMYLITYNGVVMRFRRAG